MKGPHLRTGDLCYISLSGKHVHKLFGILWHRRNIYFSNYLFIYLLIIYLYEYGLLVILYFGYNPILLHKLYRLDPKGLFHLAPVSLWHTSIIVGFVCLGFLETFLAFWHSKYYRFISYICYCNPKISHYSKIPSSFYWRMVLETKT